MTRTVDTHTLDILFHEARIHGAWTDETVGSHMLEAVWNPARLGPISVNCCQVRILFVVLPEAKGRLKPCLGEGNVGKTMAAPATAIIGHDFQFPDHLPRLIPHVYARAWFEGNLALIKTAAFHNGTLQGAYFMLAACALGLGCGPKPGFDNEKVDREFIVGEGVWLNFLRILGHGDPGILMPCHPRPDYVEACRIM